MGADIQADKVIERVELRREIEVRLAQVKGVALLRGILNVTELFIEADCQLRELIERDPERFQRQMGESLQAASLEFRRIWRSSEEFD
jgi:hypothetical protein